MKLHRLLATGALGLASSLILVPSALADDATATVSVLHAVPDATVDVYANGEILIDDFVPGTLAGPLQLPAGNYDLKVVAGDAVDIDAPAIIEANGVAVPGGANITVVAHLSEDGTPVLTPFVNDTSASAEGGRITVRHTAAAPAVDVRAGGDVVISALVNPNEAKLDLAPGTLNVDVTPAGSDDAVIGPVDVTVEEGKNLIVYAWGSLTGENLTVATQSVDLMEATPEPSASPSPSMTTPAASPSPSMSSAPTKPGLPSTGGEGTGSAVTSIALIGAVAVAGSAAAVARRRSRA